MLYVLTTQNNAIDWEQGRHFRLHPETLDSDIIQLPATPLPQSHSSATRWSPSSSAWVRGQLSGPDPGLATGGLWEGELQDANFQNDDVICLEVNAKLSKLAALSASVFLQRCTSRMLVGCMLV